MSANINDKFTKAGDGTGAYPVIATVSAARASGDSVLSCNSLSGWAIDTAVHFTTYRLNSDGSVDTTSQTCWKGIVSGNTITNLTRIAGASDSGNLAGDMVELNPTIGWLSDMVEGLLASHTQSGALKEGIVGTSQLAGSSVTTSKISDKTITGAKLADETVTADKLDFATFGNSALVRSSSNVKLTSSDQTICSIDITEPGTYLAMGVFSGYGTAPAYIIGKILKNRSSVSASVYQALANGAATDASGSVFGISQCEAGDAITLACSAGGSGMATAVSGRCSLNVVRIG